MRTILRSAILTALVCAGSSPVSAPGAALSAVPANVASVDPATHVAGDFFGVNRLYVFELRVAAADFAKMPPRGRAMRGRDDDDSRSGFTKVPATLRFNGRDWGALTIRYKGNSSYRGTGSLLKRSLKLDFNDADKNRSFFGLSELNLNNNAFDPSQMRETLAYDVFRRAGVPAPRTAYAKVFISVPGQLEKEYAGLFTIVEEIDQKFFSDRWKQKVSVLAKPEGLYGMPEFGSDWKSYVQPYSIRVATNPTEVSRLTDFVRFLNRASNEEFARRVDEYLDVDEFLRFLAIQVLLVNSDSPLAMDHNYWLTLHPTTHKIVWVPWDMNEAFGTFGGGDPDLSVHRPSLTGRFPLADRMLAIPAMVKRYNAILRDILATNVNLARLEPQMRDIATTIRDAVASDPTASSAAFESNFAARSTGQADSDTDLRFGRMRFGWGGHSGPPLRSFLADRIDSVSAQLEGK